jgi:large subunit ribosomal protein L29
VKIAEIRKMSTDELTKQVPAIQQEIADLRLRLYRGEAQNVRALRVKRKDLARVYTVLGEKLAKESV